MNKCVEIIREASKHRHTRMCEQQTIHLLIAVVRAVIYFSFLLTKFTTAFNYGKQWESHKILVHLSDKINSDSFIHLVIWSLYIQAIKHDARLQNTPAWQSNSNNQQVNLSLSYFMAKKATKNSTSMCLRHNTLWKDTLYYVPTVKLILSYYIEIKIDALTCSAEVTCHARYILQVLQIEINLCF